MGNCVFKGFGEEVEEEMIKVVTSNGGIMELHAPITAENITNEFPGQAIYRTRDDFFSQPLLHNEELQAGEPYYLLPFNKKITRQNNSNNHQSMVTPSYRMSVGNQKVLKRADHSHDDDEALPRYNNNNSSGGGVWKVKLVISPEQLAEILAQESRTEALIECVRTVAKCGNAGSSSSSVASSDQWSVASSSWKATMLFAANENPPPMSPVQ